MSSQAFGQFRDALLVPLNVDGMHEADAFENILRAVRTLGTGQAEDAGKWDALLNDRFAELKPIAERSEPSTDDWHASLDHLNRLLRRSLESNSAPEETGRMFLGVGVSAMRCDQWEVAEDAFSNAVSRFWTSGDSHELAAAYYNLAVVKAAGGETHAALDALDGALSAYDAQSAESPSLLAATRFQRALAFQELNQRDQAIREAQIALELARDTFGEDHPTTREYERFSQTLA